jgi:hypothetical protein
MPATSTRNQVEREGGRFGAGLIRDVAVVTRGEARTHGLWLDSEFLNSVTEEIETRPYGVKSRFTHPTLSDDGLGKFLGTIEGPARLDGDMVRADLHLSETAHSAPDGDLAAYVMDMAERHPEHFGMSIVFSRDTKAEESFREDKGERSPDPDNKKNLRHVRLKELYAGDIVDDPAANPEGLFHRDHIAHDAEALLSFSLGLSDTIPELTTLDVDPGRVAGFVQRFLDGHNLTIITKEAIMPTEIKPVVQAETATDPVVPASKPESPTAPVDLAANERARCLQIAKHATEFGLASLAADLIGEGLSVNDALHRLKDAKLTALSRSAPAPGPSGEEMTAPKKGSREAEIVTHRDKYRVNPELAKICESERSYVNGQLLSAGKKPLTDTEAAAAQLEG